MAAATDNSDAYTQDQSARHEQVMYESSYDSVPYDPEGFKKPGQPCLSSKGRLNFNPLVLLQGNAPRHSSRFLSLSKHGSVDSFYDERATHLEKVALLEEAKRIRAEERKNTYLWLSIWTAVFGLLMLGLVFYATRKNVPKAVHEVLDKSMDKFATKWDPKMGAKECRSLDKKFVLFNHQVTGENFSSWSLHTPSVFFLQDDRDLTFEEACSMESFANLLAELVVYALRLKCAKSPSDKPKNTLNKALAAEYKNLVPLNVDGSAYFKGTPLAGSFQCRSKRSVDQALVMTAWRFGGLAVYPDIVLKTRNFIHFPANQLHVGGHYVVSYVKCSPPLYYLITRLAAHSKQDLDLQAVAKDGFDALCCSGICPDVVTNDKTSICDGQCPVMLISNVSEAHHHCPRIWRELENSFRASQAPPHHPRSARETAK